MMVRTLWTVILCLISGPALAKVDVSQTVPIQMPSSQIRTSLWARDLDQLLPKDLNKDSDANSVVSRVGDRAIQNWLSSPEVQGTAMARTAKSVEGAMKSEVSLGGDKKKNKNEIDHRLSFQLLALQSTTKVEYKGYLDAAWNYDLHARKSVVEVFEKIGGNKDLTFSHTASTVEDISAMGIRWNW